jgi:BirA family biotin operon repressor/biotin-[acetyl-CoA-carboxylase] ligase
MNASHGSLDEARARFEHELRTAAGSLGATLRIHHLESVGSTNTWALDAEQAAESSGPVVVIADEQSAGRGQHGRAWFAARGASLAMSFVPRSVHRALEAPRLSISAAVAARDALAGALPRPLRLKWPNDLLVDDRKLAGILVESRSIGVRRVGPVIGIGINLRIGREEFPPELRELATSIALVAGRVPERAVLAGRFVLALDRWLERAREQGARDLTAAYLDGLGIRGRAIEIETSSALRAGTCSDLSFASGVALADGSAVALAQILSLREVPT